MTQENETYKQVDFTKKQLSKEYDSCIFIGCTFENTKFSNITFIECEFINCNLSNIKINASAFKVVRFEKCKLLGVNFSDSNPFLIHFNFIDCDLTLASFYQLEIKN